MAPHKAILRYDCSSSSAASLGGDVTNANLFEHYLNVLFMNLRTAAALHPRCTLRVILLTIKAGGIFH